MNVPEKRRGRGKIRAGDDSALAPFRPWHALWRSTFHTRLADDATSADRLYTVDIDYFDWDSRLYVDGKQAAVATLPAKFPVPGGVIDVGLTASLERALTLRYHWLIDADPWWLES